jgi:hypothetical protein
MACRTYKRRRPILREGKTPRRAQSSTVDFGTRIRAGTSDAVITSSAAKGRASHASARLLMPRRPSPQRHVDRHGR